MTLMTKILEKLTVCKLLFMIVNFKFSGASKGPNYLNSCSLNISNIPSYVSDPEYMATQVEKWKT